MKLDELLNPPLLLEGKRLSVYEELLPLLTLREEGEGGGGDAGGVPTVGDSTGGSGDITGEPVQPPETTTPTRTGAGWYSPSPFRPTGGRWFNEFYHTLKNLIIANNVLKRMGELGISKEGKKRVKMAAKVAARNVNLLLSNPGATAYRIPVWTFDQPKAPKIKRWNEAFAHQFKVEMSKLTEQQIED